MYGVRVRDLSIQNVGVANSSKQICIFHPFGNSNTRPCRTLTQKRAGEDRPTVSYALWLLDLGAGKDQAYSKKMLQVWGSENDTRPGALSLHGYDVCLCARMPLWCLL